jgi:hypothetical protein
LIGARKDDYRGVHLTNAAATGDQVERQSRRRSRGSRAPVISG